MTVGSAVVKTAAPLLRIGRSNVGRWTLDVNVSARPIVSVRNAPPKPLLIFDGDCHFCRRWIERWRELTAGAVEYAPFQEVAERFPEIPREAFERSVQFIETDGTVFSGAEAVFRSLGHKRSRRWMIWCYERVPGFAAITEAAYRLVARNRRTASFFTRLLWGNDVRQPTYFESRRWFLRSLGGVYLIAFLSLWMQVDGLIGEHGILPVAEFLPAARAHLGGNAPFVLPTLCWLNASDAFLHFLCGAGAVLSVLLIAGFLPVVSLVLLFVFYLSLTIAGQTFLSFQWDILLLETGFLAIFFAPFRWRLGGKRDEPFSPRRSFPPEAAALQIDADVGRGETDQRRRFLVEPDRARLSLLDATAPDRLWLVGASRARDGSASFPLSLSCSSKCVVPFFIWAPRRVRHLACALFVLLQLLIALTGNYCFFNLLTIALCLLLIDDAVWPRKRSW